MYFIAFKPSESGVYIANQITSFNPHATQNCKHEYCKMKTCDCGRKDLEYMQHYIKIMKTVSVSDCD